MSLARAHRERTLAAAAGLAIAAAGEITVHAAASASEYELQLARLGLDLRRLHEIQSVEKKIALKRELVDGYAPWVDGVLAGMTANGRGIQDEVLVTIMIWRIDVGDYVGAMPLAAAVLRWNLALPERYKRTPATLIAEEIADAALKTLGKGEDFDLLLLREVADLTADADMHDQVRAKLEKALGLSAARLAESIDPDADGPAGGKRAAIALALRHLDRAHELNPASGVKKNRDALRRDIVKLTPDPGPPTPEA